MAYSAGLARDKAGWFTGGIIHGSKGLGEPKKPTPQSTSPPLPQATGGLLTGLKTSLKGFRFKTSLPKRGDNIGSIGLG